METLWHERYHQSIVFPGSSWTSWPSCNFRFVRQQLTWCQLQRTLELFWTVISGMQAYCIYLPVGVLPAASMEVSSTIIDYDATGALVQAFITCKLDYCCNSLLAGVADVRLRQLQSVQNATARVVSGPVVATTSDQSLRIFTGCLFARE